MTGLVLMLLIPEALAAALVLLVFVGQFLALFVWDRLCVHGYKVADRIVTELEAQPLPANVYDLADRRKGPPAHRPTG
jgi:hypothetical protein